MKPHCGDCGRPRELHRVTAIHLDDTLEGVCRRCWLDCGYDPFFMVVSIARDADALRELNQQGRVRDAQRWRRA